MIRVVKWKELFTRTEVEEIVVDILTELQLEIEELNKHGFIELSSYKQKTGRYRQGFERARNLSVNLIQQKINALTTNSQVNNSKVKEQTDGENNN